MKAKLSNQWIRANLGDIANLYQPITISERDLVATGYPVYGANGHIGYFDRFNHESPQIGVTCRGSTSGRVNYIPAQSWITGNAMVVNVDHNPAVNKKFLYYYLQAANLTQLVTGSGQPQITRGPLADFQVALPPLEEQQMIASALTDADDKADTLERLIAKKQSMKQGMMQQLLTGRTRLPGFETEWTPQKLGNLLSYQQPGPFIVSSEKYRDAGTPVLTAGKSFLLGYTSDRQGIYRDFPVIIFDDFTTSSQFVDFPFKVKSSAMKILSVRPGADLRYLYERMQLIDFVPVDHKRRWIAEFSKIELLMPQLDEQIAIATVLNDANREIDSLRERLEKARDLKTGMMQQLLTGRVRLPVEVAV